MKHFAYTLLGIALLMSASCAKMEENAVPEQSDSFRIKATIDNSEATKTAYTEDQGYKTAHISWMTGDQFKLVVFNKSTHGADFYRCNVDESTINGGLAEFTLSGTFNENGFQRAGYAVYPSDLAIGGNENDGITVTLPAAYSVSGTDLTQVKVPLIGVEQDVEGHDYDFFNAVGVLKITLTNVPVSARKVVLVSEDDNLSGTFPLDPHNGLKMVDCADGTGGHSITVNFPQQTAGSTISVYMPVPVGHISAGAYFEVQDYNGTAIKTTAVTKKDIEIVKGHLLPLPAISVEDWVSIGTGKYMDDHGFYYLGIYGRSADDYADVTIQKHASEFGRYRIYRPYDSCPYVETDLPNAADYLYIDIKDATNGIVANHSYRYNNDASIMFDGCYWGYDALYHNSRIIKYDGSGNPANIQLAPYYYNFYSTNCAQNPKIEIVFPGSTPMMAGVFNYADGATASYSDGVVTVGISNSTITGVKVKAAASIDAGILALQGGDADLTFTEPGSQDLNLPLGTYYLIYKVETDGHGYVYKNGGQFEVVLPTISLNAGMITVSSDATYGGGTPYDGSGYAALVDNDLSTYWHSAYQTQSGDDYDWADLDPTYGAYIDIALTAPIKTFQLQYTTRHNNGGNVPRAMVFAVSDNGTDWSIVDTIENESMNVGAGVTVLLPALVADSSFSYLRIGITKAGAGPSNLTVPQGGSTSIAEIVLFGQN